jgi:hypothetical protein
MASEIIGLFTNPQQYLAAQDASMQQQFARNAEMAPLNRARMLYQQAGYQAGQGVGGALGGTDPQLDLISKRNVLLSQLDPNDPASYMKVAQVAAQIGDQQFAMAIAQEGRKAQSEMALAQQRLREQAPKPQAIPDKIQIAERIAESKGFVRGTPEFSAEVAKQLEGAEKPESRIPVGSDREAVSLELFNKPFGSLTTEQRAVVNQRIETTESARASATAPKIVLPGQTVEPKDWLKFSEYISKDPVMDRTSTIISDAPTAIETIRTSTQNSFSAASLPAAIAKLTGEGKNMSNQDIARYARTGGLTDRLSQDVVGFFTGKKTDVTKQQAEQFAVALYRGALIERKKFIEDQAAQLGYDKSPNYQTSIQQLDKKLSQFSLVNPQGGKTPTPTENKPFDADKERRYQDWKAKQTGATR